MFKLAAEEPYSFLLESVEGGAVRGRYSFIGLKPDLIWRCQNDAAEICRNPQSKELEFSSWQESIHFGFIAPDFMRSAIDMLPDEMPPMAAGLVGYMSYDMVRLMEDIPDANSGTMNLPLGLLSRRLSPFSIQLEILLL